MNDIKLYNCDCLEVVRKLPRDKCVIVTDQPFNVNYHYDSYNDNMKESDYYEWLYDVFNGFPLVCVHYPEALYKISFQLGLFPERVISWVYNSNTPRQHRDIAFFGIKPDLSKVRQDYKNLNDKRIQKRIMDGRGSKLYDWWNVNQVKNVSSEKTEHPCQMPLRVMLNIIGVLPDDYVVVDPFMGSGTTGVACKVLKRDFVGVEIDRKYFDIACQRINNGFAQKEITENELNSFPIFL